MGILKDGNFNGYDMKTLCLFACLVMLVSGCYVCDSDHSLYLLNDSKAWGCGMCKERFGGTALRFYDCGETFGISIETREKCVSKEDYEIVKDFFKVHNIVFNNRFYWNEPQKRYCIQMEECGDSNGTCHKLPYYEVFKKYHCEFHTELLAD